LKDEVLPKISSEGVKDILIEMNCRFKEDFGRFNFLPRQPFLPWQGRSEGERVPIHRDRKWIFQFQNLKEGEGKYIFSDHTTRNKNTDFFPIAFILNKCAPNLNPRLYYWKTFVKLASMVFVEQVFLYLFFDHFNL
jgi:hypothetical protein